MRQIAKIALIAMAVSVLTATAAFAELAANQPAKPAGNASEVTEHFWDVGLDIGLPVYSAMQLGTLNTPQGKVNMTGTGTASFPYLGAHFSLFPSPSWFVQFGLGWIHQTGTAKFTTDVANLKQNWNDVNFDWGMNVFRLDAGIFKILGSSQMVRPKIGIGLGGDYLSFFDEAHANKTWSGWTLFPYVLLGLDVQVYSRKNIGTFLVGADLRADVVYTLSALHSTVAGDSDTLTFLWIPLSVYVTAGWRF
jgi:hypothetical protein